MRNRRILGLFLVFAVLATACGDDSGEEATATTTTSTTSTTVAPPTTAAATTTVAPTTSAAPEPPAPATLVLNPHPYWDNPVTVVAPTALDELAAAYVAGLDEGAEPEVERFLFGTLPVVAFDEIFAGTTPQRRAELLWMLYLSGYFGGRWLRGEIVDAQPDAFLADFSVPPDEEAFLADMAAVQVGLETLDADDAAVLAAARATLFDSEDEEGDVVRGMTDGFGYNQGYMQEILASPPEGIAATPAYQITCGGLFDCDYATPKLAVLADLAELQAALNSDEPPDADLVAELTPIQEAAIPRGIGVWSGGLSVQGFSQGSYDQLLDVSSSFLETIQATALVNVRASINGDAADARIGLVAVAAMSVWLGAYIAGLTDGEGEIELPAFG